MNWEGPRHAKVLRTPNDVLVHSYGASPSDLPPEDEPQAEAVEPDGSNMVEPPPPAPELPDLVEEVAPDTVTGPPAEDDPVTPDGAAADTDSPPASEAVPEGNASAHEAGGEEAAFADLVKGLESENKKEDLIKMATEAGLDATGTKADLAKRLASHILA